MKEDANDYKPQPIPWVDEAVWARRTARDRDPKSAIFDPIWRIANLYRIRSRSGEFIPFVPKPEQRVILWDLYVRKVRNEIVLKARRLGISTLLMIICLDRTAFIRGHKSILVDKGLSEAKIKLSDMVKVAWEQLQPIERLPFEVKFNAERMVCRLRNTPDDAERSMRVTVSGRGSEAHFLVVSEWGTIQFKDQEKSNEIKTGAMIAAQFGVRVIETTWKGGKGGDVWDYVKLALSLPDSLKGEGDWFLRFFPWYVDPDYTLKGDFSRIDSGTNEYLDTMEMEIGTTFTPGQRFWYWMEKETQGVLMKREFPTVLRECWTAPIEGSIYGEQMDLARTSGRVTNFEIDTSLTVDTFSDLGAPANTAMIFVQHVAGTRRIIDFDSGLNVTLKERCRLLADKGYRYGTFYLPHDGGALQKGGVSYQTELKIALKEVGIDARVVIVPRTRDKWLGINAVLTLLSSAVFHATKCATLIEHLDAYRRQPDPEVDGRYLDEPVHDYTSHSADACRNMGEALLAGFLPATSTYAMTNSYFEPTVLQALAAASAGHVSSQKVGIIVQPDKGITGRPRTFILEPTGHLRVWETPRSGSAYIIVMTGKALSVWRQVEQDQEGRVQRGGMVAAIMPDLRTMQPLMAEWAFELSCLYGRCPVTPDITSGPGWVEALQALGSPMYIRRMAPQERRVGTAVPIRKPGWETTPEIRLQAYQQLQATIHLLDIWCPETLRQLGMIASGPEDRPLALEGTQEDWAYAAAVASVVLPLATPWQPGQMTTSTRAAWDHNPDGMAQALRGSDDQAVMG